MDFESTYKEFLKAERCFENNFYEKFAVKDRGCFQGLPEKKLYFLNITSHFFKFFMSESRKL